MELNAEQIKKALECCYTNELSCIDCPFQYQNKFKECTNLNKNALALIKELTAEVDKLGKTLEKMSAYYDRAIRLTEVHTIRKMRDTLKKYYDRNEMFLGYLIVTNIIRVANEMLADASCDNTCISCGEIIPEGRQICPNCEKESESTVMLEKIEGRCLNVDDTV